MNKSPDAFRTISEVADWLGTPTHVLRFWESRFTQVKPVKRAGGRRYYRPSDMALLGGIKKLLHDDGLTIRGAQKILREQGVKYVAAMSKPVDGEPAEMEEAGFIQDAEPEPQTADVVSMTPTAPAAEAANAAPDAAEDLGMDFSGTSGPELDGVDIPAEAEGAPTDVAAEDMPFDGPTDGIEEFSDPEPFTQVEAPVAAEPEPEEVLATAPPEAAELDFSGPAPEDAESVLAETTAAFDAAPVPEPEQAVPGGDAGDHRAAVSETSAVDAPPQAAPTEPPAPVEEGPTLSEIVLGQLHKGHKAQPAALRPLFDQLVALRSRMDQGHRG